MTLATIGVLLALQVGPVGGPITISSNVSGIMVPYAIAHADSTDKYLAFYLDNVGGPRTAMIDAATGAVGASTAQSLSFGLFPSVAWNAGVKRFLIVAVDSNYDHVYALVLDENGAAVGGTTPFIVDSGQASMEASFPVVASNGTSWGVFWERDIQATGAFVIRGRIVDATSTNAAPSFAAASFDVAVDAIDNQIPCAAALPGSGYMVTWLGSTGSGPTTYTIGGRTVSAAGVMGTQRNYLTTTFGAAWPKVVANPTRGEYLIAYNQYVLPGGDVDPVVQRVDAAGATLGSAADIDLSSSRYVQDGSVTPVYNETAQQYLVTWMEGGSSYNVRAARLNGPDLGVFQTSITIANPASTTGEIYTMAASRAGSTQVIVGWTRDPINPDVLEAQRYDLAVNPGAPAVSSVTQQHQDGTSIGQGLTTNQPGFLAVLTGTDPQSDPMTVQVEAQVVPAAYAGTLTAAGSVYAGSPPPLWVPLARGQSYHWRGRLADSGGLVSPWMDMGTSSPSQVDLIVRSNVAPSGSLPVMLLPDGTILPVGGSTDLALTIQVMVNDADNDDVKLEVEVVSTSSGFSGTATASGAFTFGTRATVAIPAAGEGGRQWRWRVVDSALDTTGWASFGNPDGQADYSLYALGSTGVATKCGGSAGGWGATLLLLTAFAAAARR